MAVSPILNFGKFSTFDLDDIEALYKGFSGWGVHFWSELFFGYGVKVKVKSDVKGQIYLYNL